ncbi:EmrB/QacA subfamily drug resistance transporter [Nocardia tenerifensis]|uniref:EmrB/QacA subfamily drug resistance transporter n=1 Tax=Nocardia tenerifensis TaxID=228006 RepID=A0A318JVY0_9NOCA|nr:DHA2 family efflux MFS transporter permease subunit [Nocardia tenerifensis]PXX57623.1 EmrB/QacA subfamily drug resistance transporter [Nocardia tenerifensis]
MSTTAARARIRRWEPRRMVLALACIGSFSVVMDATIVSVTLPDLRADLGFSPAALPWAVNAYTLAFAGCLLFGGRCADVFGRRRIMLIGLGVFTVARVAAGLAESPATLLTARAVQGVGGALLMPVTLSMLTTTFVEPAARARALATWSAVASAGAASGPVVGGLLTDLAGWRWVFFVLAPLGVVGMVGAIMVLPQHISGPNRMRLDMVGALLVTAGITGVVLAIMRSAATGWADRTVLGALLAGFALIGVFAVHQRFWSAEPILPLDIFRARSVSSANVVMFLLGTGFLASPVLLSLYLQDVQGYSPLLAGIGYLPVGAAMFLGARSAGSLTVRWGARTATMLYCAIGAAGLLCTACGIAVDASYLWTVLISGTILGFGTAAAFTPITVAATDGVPAERSGLAAGVLNTVRQTSGAVGLAASSAVALSAGYAASFGACAACLAAACLVAMVAMPRR